MARHFHLETTMRAGCRITTLTWLGGENMLETLRFEHFKSPSTFFSQAVRLMKFLSLHLIFQDGLAKFLSPCVSFIEAELAAGHSVLVHCLAGAHRY